MPRTYFYVVDRDFGFAPNPFHGTCTLATCKPDIRARAQPGDWVVGMGGARLQAQGRCVFAMKVTETCSFTQYWGDPEYRAKRPVRNGSLKMMVGDNIYHRQPEDAPWMQADSHHSNADGTTNLHNLAHDTKADRVLISRRFVYFGRTAVAMPTCCVRELGYQNGRGYRVYGQETIGRSTDWLELITTRNLNQVIGDPFDFDNGGRRYSGQGSRLI